MAILNRRGYKEVSAFNAAAIAALALVGSWGLDASRARADDLIVRYDQSQLLRLPRPVAEIIIGNASIADVTVQGGNLLVVTGKTFGVTNIIALDSDKNIIQDQRIMVERDERNVLNLHKGVNRQTYTCTPNCSPMVTIGDDPEFFNRVIGANQQKNKAAEATGSDSGAGQ
jgi:Flp pilus assembly secretin CpaC